MALEIAGAPNTSYPTPPSTTNDNGAIFTATVANSFGNVISTDAILTVR